MNTNETICSVAGSYIRSLIKQANKGSDIKTAEEQFNTYAKGLVDYDLDRFNRFEHFNPYYSSAVHVEHPFDIFINAAYERGDWEVAHENETVPFDVAYHKSSSFRVGVLKEYQIWHGRYRNLCAAHQRGVDSDNDVIKQAAVDGLAILTGNAGIRVPSNTKVRPSLRLEAHFHPLLMVTRVASESSKIDPKMREAFDKYHAKQLTRGAKPLEIEEYIKHAHFRTTKSRTSPHDKDSKTFEIHDHLKAAHKSDPNHPMLSQGVRDNLNYEQVMGHGTHVEPEYIYDDKHKNKSSAEHEGDRVRHMEDSFRKTKPADYESSGDGYGQFDLADGRSTWDNHEDLRQNWHLQKASDHNRHARMTKRDELQKAGVGGMDAHRQSAKEHPYDHAPPGEGPQRVRDHRESKKQTSNKWADISHGHMEASKKHPKGSSQEYAELKKGYEASTKSHHHRNGHIRDWDAQEVAQISGFDTTNEKYKRDSSPEDPHQFYHKHLKNHPHHSSNRSDPNQSLLTFNKGAVSQLADRYEKNSEFLRARVATRHIERIVSREVTGSDSVHKVVRRFCFENIRDEI